MLFFSPRYSWWLFRNMVVLFFFLMHVSELCRSLSQSRRTQGLRNVQNSNPHHFWVALGTHPPHLHPHRDQPKVLRCKICQEPRPCLAVPVRSVFAVTPPGKLRGMSSPWNILTLQRQLCLWLVILPWHFEVFQLCSLTENSPLCWCCCWAAFCTTPLLHQSLWELDFSDQ